MSISDDRFGKVQWPFEEYAYLCVVYELDKFYDEVSSFLEKFDIDKDVFENLLVFQKRMIKKPFCEDFSFDCNYNFVEYFNALLNDKNVPLVNSRQRISVAVRKIDCWETFAKVVAWYGRKDSNSTYIKTAFSEKKE